MVEGIGIDSRAGDLAQHAHVLPGVGGHQYSDLWMEKHAFGHQRGFNGMRGGPLVQPAQLHLVDHGQGHRACRGDAHRRMKLRSVVLRDIEKVSGSDGSRHGRRGKRACHWRHPGLVCALGAVPHRGSILGIGLDFRILRKRNTGHARGQAVEGGRGRLCAPHCAGQKHRQQRGNRTSRCAKRFEQERASHCQPEPGKERDGHIKRQIRRHRLDRLPGRVHHGDIRAANASGKPGLLHLFQHPQIQLVASVGLLPHIRVFGGGLVLLHVFGGVLVQAFSRQLLTIGSRLPCAPELIHKFGVFGRDLPVEILQLAANLHHPGKVRPVLDAQLRLFLVQLAVAGMELLQQCSGKVNVFVLQVGIGGNDQLGIALGGGAVLSLAQNAVAGGDDQLPAQLVDLQQGRGVLGLALLPIGQRLRGGEDAVPALEFRQAMLVLLDASLEIFELALKPVRGLSGRLHAGLAVLLPIGANQAVHHGGRERCVPGAKANLNHQRARQGLDVKSPLKSLQQPGLGVAVSLLGAEAGKTARKIAHKAGRLVELESGDHPPGQLVAAKNIGLRLKLERRCQRGGRNGGLSSVKAERRCRRGAQRYPGAGFVLVGGKEAIQKAQQQQSPQHGRNHAAAADQNLPERAQGGGGTVPAEVRPGPRIGFVG